MELKLPRKQMRLHVSYKPQEVCHARSDDSMSDSGSASPEFDTRRGRKSLMRFLNLGARRSGDVQFIIATFYMKRLHKIPNPSAVHMLRKHRLLYC